MDARVEGAGALCSQRSGYRKCGHAASTERITLRISKIRRGSRLPEDSIEHCSRVDGTVIAAAPKAMIYGMSARKTKRMVNALDADRMGPS